MKCLKSIILSAMLVTISILLTNAPVRIRNYDESLTRDLNISESWILSPFVIDDTGAGDYSWAEAILQPWCSGAGVVNNPYVIANIAIDGGNTTDCIVIRNSSKHFVIRNSTFSSAGWAGEPPYMGCITLVDVSNATLVNNTCRNSDGNGINIYRSNGIKIRENTLKNNERGISSLEGDSHKIINNSLTSNNVLGIEIQYGDNNQIKENTFRDGRVGVVLTSSLNNTVEANTIQVYSRRGIYFSSSANNNTIFNNHIVQAQYGIHLQTTTHYNNILSNDISYSTDNGIVLDGGSMATDNNVIVGNRISNSSGNAIRLVENCDDNRFENNTIIDNTLFGIRIENSNCRRNAFHTNYFITNGIHVLDLGSSTYWNSSEIGNYWDNYTGSDSDDDGIGDIPHDIYLSPLREDSFPIWDDGDDAAPPDLTVVTPSELQIVGDNSPAFALTSRSLYIDSIWYNVNNSLTNYTSTGLIGNIFQAEWESLNDGMVTLDFYANDSLGNVGSVDVTIEKDATNPSLIVHSPENDETYGSTAPSFNITIIEKNFLSSWYTLDGGATNFSISGSFGSINQTAWNNAPSGEVTILFYAKDEAGNVAYEDITVIKSMPEPAIPGYNLIFLMMFIATVLLARCTRKRME